MPRHRQGPFELPPVHWRPADTDPAFVRAEAAAREQDSYYVEKARRNQEMMEFLVRLISLPFRMFAVLVRWACKQWKQ